MGPKRRKRQTGKYRIVRFRFSGPPRTVRGGLTLEEARAHCRDPRTRGGSGRTAWFDGYTEEEK